MKPAKDMTRLAAATAVMGGLALGGCGQRAAGVWAWSPPAPLEWRGSAEAPVGPSVMAGGTNPGVVVFGGGFVGVDSPEAYRRDSMLASGQDEAMPDRLGWPEAPRPSLDRTRIYRGGRDAASWTYPTSPGWPGRRDGGSWRNPHHGAWGEWRMRP